MAADVLPPSLERLVEELEQLPGIGRRSAERLAHHLVRAGGERALALADAIRTACSLVRPCPRCRAPSERSPCALCSDPTRDDALLLVVESARDLAAVEARRLWTGRYLVLGARLAPHDGVTTGDLPLDVLRGRVREGNVREVVLATNADVEGDGTALAVAEALQPLGVRVSRLARGLPAGGQIEHQSAAVLAEALAGRRALDPPPSAPRNA